MGTGSEDGDQPGAEDFEHFMEIRRHVKRMQAGTPILLRTTDGPGQEELQICTFWVTTDLQLLKWRDQEGSNVVRELPIGAIADVVEDAAEGAAAAPEDAHHALTLVLNADGSAHLPRTMGLICASPEDLASWRDGLKFLVGATPPPAQGERATAASGPSSPEADGDLRRQLRKQAEATERLRKENEMLREMLRRKDTTIAQLLRDLQGRAVTADRCGKTESTSRESDDHLRDREVAILQRKNRRLQKALRAKQQTLADVLQLLGRVSQQQGAESSAVEDVGQDDEGDDDSDVAPVSLGAGSLGGELAARRAGTEAQRQRVRIATSQPADPGTGSDREMLEALAALRQRSKMQSAPSQGAASFRPPPRGDAGAAPSKATSPAASSKAAAAARPSPTAAVPSPSPSPSQRPAPTAPKAAPPQSPQAAAPPEQLFKVVRQGGPETGAGHGTAAATAAASGGHMGSHAALQALARELALLEEKKRVVEQLARRLEPPSDGEEDDGFPLR